MDSSCFRRRPTRCSTATAPGTSTTAASFSATAAAGVDYNAASGAITFTPGQTSKYVYVSLRGDATPELDEAFTLALMSKAPSWNNGQPPYVPWMRRR